MSVRKEIHRNEQIPVKLSGLSRSHPTKADSEIIHRIYPLPLQIVWSGEADSVSARETIDKTQTERMDVVQAILTLTRTQQCAYYVTHE